MKILKSQIVVMWSWGAEKFYALENGLQFKVSGFIFKGNVRVLYNEGSDTFEVQLIKKGEIVKTIEDVYIENLVDVIDQNVEKTENYEQTVEQEYKIK